MYTVLDSFADWHSSYRACQCGSFNVRCARAAPNCVEATKYVCDDCGADWMEET